MRCRVHQREASRRDAQKRWEQGQVHIPESSAHTGAPRAKGTPRGQPGAVVNVIGPVRLSQQNN